MADWKEHGIRIVRAGELDSNTPQTPGMTRAAAITHATTGASKLWAGTVTVAPAARTGAHHHGELETVLYIVRGRARFRWGDHLEYVEEAGPGDFIFVPPFVPHQEMNARADEPVEAVVVRSGQEPIVVNLDIASPDQAEENGPGIPFHPARESSYGSRPRLPSAPYPRWLDSPDQSNARPLRQPGPTFPRAALYRARSCVESLADRRRLLPWPARQSPQRGD